MTASHERIQELLGAYAVDAVDIDERQLIESHLVGCDQCRAEVDELTEAASLLGASQVESISDDAVEPSSDLWARIESEIAVSGREAPAPVLAFRPRRSYKVMVVAAAVALFFGLSGLSALRAVMKDHRTPLQLQQLAAERALTRPGSKQVTLTNPAGDVSVDLVIGSGGRGFVTHSSLPVAATGETYQLWAVVNGTPISAGVLGADPNASAFAAEGNVTAFAITKEASGGVVKSTNFPVVSGSLT